jgi:hypothetical protein
MLQHEAAALVHLHAQATNVQNIRNLVHVVLDLSATSVVCSAATSPFPSSRTPSTNCFWRR